MNVSRGQHRSTSRRWCAVLTAMAMATAGFVSASAAAAEPAPEAVVAGPMDNSAYFFSGPRPSSGPIADLDFSVYATEVKRAADGAIWVRDYLSISRISPDGQSFRQVIGLSDYDDLGDPAVGTPFANVGLDPAAVPTQLDWVGGRRIAVDPSGGLVFVDRNRLFRVADGGVIEHLAGTGVEGSTGDGGPAVDADIAPSLIQVDANGNVWFVDVDGTRLRRIATDGTISTVAAESGWIADFAVSPAGRVALLAPVDEPSGRVLSVKVIPPGGSPTSVVLEDETICDPEYGASSSQSQFSPQFVGEQVEFVGLDTAGTDGWSRCTVDVSTGATARTSLGLDPFVDRRSNIELGDGVFWYMRYLSEDLPNSGLIRVGASAPEPVPTVSLGDQSGLERDSVTGSVFVPVTLSEPLDEPVVVGFYTQDGSASAGPDYTRWGTPAKPRTVTIPAGSLQTTINVPVLADSQAEADEDFSVVLASVSGGGAVIGDSTGTATIVDADGVSTENPAITVSNVSMTEGDTGQRRMQFLVHLSRAPSSNVTIVYSTSDGTAVAPGDYVAKLPGTVVFAPGQISKTIDVLVNSNTSVGSDRDFQLSVSVTGGSPVEELQMVGSARIVDDD